jgi:hypothetical protein
VTNEKLEIESKKLSKFYQSNERHTLEIGNAFEEENMSIQKFLMLIWVVTMCGHVGRSHLVIPR